MDNDTHKKMEILGRKIAQSVLARRGNGVGTPERGCENILYAPITVSRFDRGRTGIDQVASEPISAAPAEPSSAASAHGTSQELGDLFVLNE